MYKIFVLIILSFFSVSSTAYATVDLSGKTITWVVPFKEGGGTSRFARFIQPFLTKYLPGNPDIQVMHIPGGGAIKGSNYFQKNAKPDGTYLFGCSTSVIVNVATGNPLVEYNLSEYRPVLLLPQNTHWFTRTDLADGPHDLSKLLERDLVLYALKTPASADLFHIWVFDKLGIKGAKPIPGLSSSGGYQAFLRGEIHISSHGAANYNVVVRHLHDMSGGSIVTAPSIADLENNEVGALVRKYVAGGNGASGEYRMKLFHAIRDVTADAYGGWRFVTNLQAGGGLYAQRIVTRRHYDLEGAKAAALHSAHIEVEAAE